MAAEITQIDIENFTSQTYEVQDTNLISSFEINTSLTSSSYIELFIYDIFIYVNFLYKFIILSYNQMIK